MNGEGECNDEQQETSGPNSYFIVIMKETQKSDETRDNHHQ